MPKPLLFGEKLRLFRRMKKWSVRVAAEKAGLSEERYEDIEAADHEPRAGDILRIMNGWDIALEPEDFERPPYEPAK